MDGYAGYHGVLGVILVGCRAHARRGFTDTLKSLPSGHRGGPVLADEGLAFCDKLFKIEKSLNELMPKERLQRRKEDNAPVMLGFKAWLIKFGKLSPIAVISGAYSLGLSNYPQVTEARS